MKLECIHAGRNHWLEDHRIYHTKDVLISQGQTLVELREIPNILWGIWRFKEIKDEPILPV